MRKLSKNRQKLENSVEAYACACLCSCSTCYCAPSNLSANSRNGQNASSRNRTLNRARNL